MTRDALLRERVAAAQEALRRASELRLCMVRAGAAFVLLTLAALLGFGWDLGDWRMLVPLLAAYFVLALALALASRQQGKVGLVARLAPSLDVLVVYALQTQSLPVSPFPAGVAGWSLGAFVLLVLLASLTLDGGMIAWTAGLAFLCEGALQRQAGVGYGAVIASGVVLAAAASITVFGANRVGALVRRVASEEVALRVEAEKNEELRKAQEQLRAANDTIAREHERLLDAQAQAERLSRVLVHDLKAPISSILALTEGAREAVKSGRVGPETVDDLAVVHREAQRVFGMTVDLLALSRLEDGAMKPRLQVQSMYALVTEAAEAHRADAQKHGVTLRALAPVGLASMGDPELTRRMVDTLVITAMRYTQPGNRIEIEARPGLRGVELVVRNDGPPVPPSRAAQLFDRTTTTEDGREHRGFGLYFCRMAAEAQGGSIALTQSPGWPVEFVVTLRDTAGTMQKTG
jgi:two-component system, OmpR family, heavy metal sensor histidine kinase CusS